jgi:hypothetical protein
VATAQRGVIEVRGDHKPGNSHALILALLDHSRTPQHPDRSHIHSDSSLHSRNASMTSISGFRDRRTKRVSKRIYVLESWKTVVCEYTSPGSSSVVG